MDEGDKLLGAQKGRRSATEVNVSQRALGERSVATVESHLCGEGVQVVFYIAAILFGVDPEIAKLTPLAAKGNVQVEPERDRWKGSAR